MHVIGLYSFTTAKNVPNQLDVSENEKKMQLLGTL